MNGAMLPGQSAEKTPYAAVVAGETIYFDAFASLKAFMAKGRSAPTPAEAAAQAAPAQPEEAAPDPPSAPAGYALGDPREAGVLERVLTRYFGYSEFRGGQRGVITAVLDGLSTVAVMPTGTGKSICYQLPALFLPGVTLVVSPLVALMRDQVESLTQRGIAATFINSQLSAEETRARLSAMQQGRYKLVFIAPERFRNAAFTAALARIKVSLFAVDEAHCISEWGHNFRPDYRQLREAIAQCNHPPVLATTATATPEVRNDIVKQLGLAKPRVVVTGFDRPNLSFRVVRVQDKRRKSEEALELIRGTVGTVVVYAATQKGVEELAQYLSRHGQPAIAYHAGLPDALRGKAQDEFMSGQKRIIVATNAFGMGVDKAEVRLVLHVDLPRSLEAYYQEAGRAGRDGEPAYCILLASEDDTSLQRFLIDASQPKPQVVRELYARLQTLAPDEVVMLDALAGSLSSVSHPRDADTALKFLVGKGLVAHQRLGKLEAQLRVLKQVGDPYDGDDLRTSQQRRRVEMDRLDIMEGYVDAGGCRQRHILSYFGDQGAGSCGRCDICLRPRRAKVQPLLPTRPMPSYQPIQLPGRAASAPPTPAFEGTFARRRTECPFCRSKVLHEELEAHCLRLHGKPAPK